MAWINTREELEAANAEGKLVVVDIYIDWCQPCKMLMPIFEKFAQENEDITFMKAELESDPSYQKYFGTQGAPTLIIYKDGVEVDRKKGYQSEEDLNAWIKSFK